MKQRNKQCADTYILEINTYTDLNLVQVWIEVIVELINNS